MSVKLSHDPRAVRTRQAFQRAFIDLLGTKPFLRITVTDIAKRAGFARHTFYNHYETKEDILNHLIDSVLDEFFSSLEKWDFYQADTDEELRMFTSFFQVWVENPELAQILIDIDIDNILIGRLKAFFTRLFYDRVTAEMPKVDFELAKYIINFNAYTLLGILKPWFQDAMKYPSEVMAGLLIQLSGYSHRRKAVESLKNVIRGT